MLQRHVYIQCHICAPILHITQVPRSDMLYAMRGNYVALGRVDPSEVRIQIARDIDHFTNMRVRI